MWVNRITRNVKRGRLAEAVAVLTAEAERARKSPTTRVYQSRLGPNHVVAIELEYESLAEFERVSAEWVATPEAATFHEKLNELLEPGGADEMWRLEE